MLQTKLIDYPLLARACQFYESRGYKQIEVPWIVEGEVSRMTSPTGTDGVAFILQDSRHLVCSAEHGFIDMFLHGGLEIHQKYYSVSPCFRDEEHDDTHSKWFMKLELFVACERRAGAVLYYDGFIKGARTLFREEGVETETIETAIGLDLMAGDLEVGSYGLRKINNSYVAYGTGLALPRLSLAQELQCQATI